VLPVTSAQRLSRAAIVGLVVVFIAVSGFALWSTQTTSSAARRAVAASELADHYQQAMKAMIREESLEQTYLKQPSQLVRDEYDTATAALVSELQLVNRDSGDSGRAGTARVLALHELQVQSVHRIFAAADRHDTAAVNLILSQELEPRFTDIAEVLTQYAEAQHDKSVAALTELRSKVSFSATVRPLVFLVGFVLVLLLCWVLRQVRRQLYRQREQAVRDSLHDPLTGLGNRALLAERFDEALHRGSDDSRTGLLLLDLDRFKEINDTLGHHYGDQLLTQIGPRLQRILRAEDTIARLGGDEFAVVLPDITGLDAAMLVAEKLRYALTAPFIVDGLNLQVEASIGVVVSGEHGDDASTLLQHADIAMYVAKKQNIGIFPYDPDADGHTPHKLTLLSDLRRALERRELVLHYQPKISLRSGEVCGVEALVRWQHPQHGLIAPDQFIPLAEHTGLIGPLTDYVLDAALTELHLWSDPSDHIPVAVNLSTRNLLDGRLADKIRALLRHHALAATVLELEVTESALMTDPLRARQTLTQLYDLGIRIAIDDFGVGYSNLSQLKTLPVTHLKIDRSFVTNMDTDPSNAHIVKSVIDLSRNLGITTIAEGVETQATMTALRVAGCDVVQGYYVSRPLPAAELASWLRTRQGRGGGPERRGTPGPALLPISVPI
jgi:diguanylate cyclase (GGDEF)-like protein